MRTIYENELTQTQQRQVLNSYIHRFTGQHKPSWVKDITITPCQFKDDKDWLEHTRFYVTKNNQLSKRHRYCESNPTWPNNPELRKEVTK